MARPRGARWLVGLAWCVAILVLWKLGGRPHSARALLALLGLTYLAGWAPWFLVSTRRSRDKAAALLLTSFSVGFALALFELPAALRLLDYRLLYHRPIEEPWRDPRNRLDPVLLHVHRPHLRLRGSSVGGDIAAAFGTPPVRSYTYDARYDANGFRNPTDLTQATYAVVGDSFIEAGRMPQAELLTTKLAELTRQTVANLGQAWYGPQQELEVLRRFALPLQPRTIVWALFEGNDLEDVERYREATEDWEGFANGLQPFRDRSFLANTLDVVLGLWPAPPPRQTRAVFGVVRTADGRQVTQQFAYPGRPLKRRELAALETVQQSWADGAADCRAQGVRLLLVFIPTKYRVYRRNVTFAETSDAVDWVANDLPDRLRAMLRDQLPDLELLDLTPGFASRAATDGELYCPDDTHWSAAGHQLAAELIARALREPEPQPVSPSSP